MPNEYRQDILLCIVTINGIVNLTTVDNVVTNAHLTNAATMLSFARINVVIAMESDLPTCV